MVGVALGLSLRGKIPFVSTFAAFLMRACDQIRMARISNGRLTLCGSHAGVSIGEDGPSQMGLEDLAFFRTILDCAVLYPADAVSTSKLVFESARREGMACKGKEVCEILRQNRKTSYHRQSQDRFRLKIPCTKERVRIINKHLEQTGA
jgi:transketolase C-terminal domain/subunit